MFYRCVVAVVSALALCTVASAQEQGQSPPQMQAQQDTQMQPSGGEQAGQDPGVAASGGLQAAVSTTLTFQSHSLSPFQQANFLEGASCPAPYTMISGACHPGFSDQVIIVNQYPNRFANTWRCGFKNNNNTSRTVWIYTLCGQ